MDARALLAGIVLLTAPALASAMSPKVAFLASPHQPFSVSSLDGSWRLDIDPSTSAYDSAAELTLFHGDERAFHLRCERTPSLLCVGDEGTVAIRVKDKTIRVLGRGGDVLAEHTFEPLEPDDTRSLSVIDMAYSADLHAFLVLAEASSFYADFQVSMKPTVGALCILDARSGKVLHPLSRWGMENWPDRITAVQGTRLVAIACSTYENHALRDEVLVFEEDRYRGVLEHRTRVDRPHREWSVASSEPNDLTLRWPGASLLEHWVVAPAEGGFSAKMRESDAIPDQPLTQSARLACAREVQLALPADFVASLSIHDVDQYGFVAADSHGRIFLQDAATKAVHVLDDRGALLCTLHVVDPDVSQQHVSASQATTDGGFTIDVHTKLMTFDAHGKLLGQEAKGAVQQIEVDDGFWTSFGGSLHLVRDGSRDHATIDRHADRHFFSEICGVVRDQDRLHMLDATGWSDEDRLWRGRIFTCALDGTSPATRDIVLSPGEEFVSLTGCARPWLVLEGCTWRKTVTRCDWLVRTDKDAVMRLEWDEGGRTVGFSPDGMEPWRLDETSRTLRKYALPPR